MYVLLRVYKNRNIELLYVHCSPQPLDTPRGYYRRRRRHYYCFPRTHTHTSGKWYVAGQPYYIHWLHVHCCVPGRLTTSAHVGS